MTDITMFRLTDSEEETHRVIVEIPFSALKLSGLRLTECEEAIRDTAAEIFGQGCLNRIEGKKVKKYSLQDLFRNTQTILEWVDGVIEERDRLKVEDTINFAAKYLDCSVLCRLGVSQLEYSRVKDTLERWVALREIVSSTPNYLALAGAFSQEVGSLIIDLMTE